MENKWIARALELGFSEAAPLRVDKLESLEMVREMCAENKCRAYGRNWTCPPACGTLEECARRMHSYPCGILMQTVGKLQKRIDSRGMRAAEEKHLRLFHALCDEIRRVYPSALCLGAGGCRICASCAYPEPCRFPKRACSSMEAYGLFVTQVCRDNGLPYHHGERTITYTACILFG